MEGPIFAISFFAGTFGIVFAVWTWIVVHQAATEAREYFRRQNEQIRIRSDREPPQP